MFFFHQLIAGAEPATQNRRQYGFRGFPWISHNFSKWMARSFFQTLSCYFCMMLISHRVELNTHIFMIINLGNPTDGYWFLGWPCPCQFGYGSIPIDTFLVGWTSIYQLFWGSLGTRVLTHPHFTSHMEHPVGEWSTVATGPVSSSAVLRTALPRRWLDPGLAPWSKVSHGWEVGDHPTYPLVNCYIAMENHHF